MEERVSIDVHDIDKNRMVEIGILVFS